MRIVDLAMGQDLDIFTGYVPHTQRQMMMTNEFTPKLLNTKELKLLFNINIHVAIEYIATNKYHFSTLYCAKCEDTTKTPWLLDSGASMHVTFDESDFSDYQLIKDSPKIRTASKGSFLYMKGMGSVFVKHQVISNDRLTSEQVVTRLYPVFHIPNLDVRLLLVGEFMFKHGSYIHGDINSIGIFNHHNQKMIEFLKRNRSETVYWLTSNIEHLSPSWPIARLTVYSVNYDTMHKHFAHVQSKRTYPEFPKRACNPKIGSNLQRLCQGKDDFKVFPTVPYTC